MRRSTRKQNEDIGHDRILKPMQQLGVLAVVVLLGAHALGQGTASGAPPQPADAAKNPWAYNLTVDGYIIPNSQSYVDPVFIGEPRLAAPGSTLQLREPEDGVVVGRL